jgi:putative metallohydrolase (TIGR04338 family)
LSNRLHQGQPRDSQRRRLYEAEDVLDGRRVSAAAKRHLTDTVRHGYQRRWVIVEGGENYTVPMYYPSVDSVQDYVDAVLATAWFRRRWGYRRITVGANPGANSRGGYGDVHMGAEHRRSESVILHEIAHNLTDFHAHAYHGPEFAAILLTLVKHQMGRDSYEYLRTSYAVHRVKYRAGMRAVPKPDEDRRRAADAAASQFGHKPRTTTRHKPVAARTRKPEGPLTYEKAYGYGWNSRTATDPSARVQDKPGWNRDMDNAWHDGWLDNNAGRERYHLRDCQAHHNGPGGCGSA